MVRKLFIFTASIGLAINLYSDLIVLNQNKSLTASGEWVYHSYQVSHVIDLIKFSILEAQLAGRVSTKLHEEIQQLSSMLQDLPSQKLRADQLSQLSDTELKDPQRNRGLSLLAEMDAAEAALLTVRLKEDEKNNSLAVSKALFANTMDILLIFLFLGFYIYDKRIADRLQKNLTQTLIDVEASSQKLRMALTEKSSKIKTTVHDLKNPLGSIKGFADLIHEEAGNKESTLEMAGIIQRISNSSLALVSALLAEDQQELFAKESFNIHECLGDACTFLKPIASEKNQTIKFADQVSDFFVFAHRHQVLDVFFNVIGNALKFSPWNSLIVIESDNQGDEVEIRIKDSGPGFSPEDLSQVFGRGSRLSAKPTGSEISTGFGLFSAKSMMSGLGGTILATNHPAGGACIILRFPSADKDLALRRVVNISPN